MGQQKGKTGNPNGRPKGSQNKTTSEIKNLMQSFISANMDALQSDFDALEPKDRLMFFEKALRFILPTQSTQELNINSLSESELIALTDSLIEKLK
jgi:hypothetical protein